MVNPFPVMSNQTKVLFVIIFRCVWVVRNFSRSGGMKFKKPLIKMFLFVYARLFSIRLASTLGH